VHPLGDRRGRLHASTSTSCCAATRLDVGGAARPRSLGASLVMASRAPALDTGKVGTDYEL
jgi:hypothetical protein